LILFPLAHEGEGDFLLGDNDRTVADQLRGALLPVGQIGSVKPGGSNKNCIIAVDPAGGQQAGQGYSAMITPPTNGRRINMIWVLPLL
jgi:hypothetical protein